MNIIFKVPEIFSFNFKASKYSFVFKSNNYYALYHSILMKFIYLDQSSYEVYERIKTQLPTKDILLYYGVDNRDMVLKIFALLFKKKIITIKSDAEELIDKEKLNSFRININLMYLILTDKCNLQCKYCYIVNSSPFGNNSTMSIETLCKSVDLFKELSMNNPFDRKIIFYGGEPLLNREVLYQGVRYIRAQLMEKTEINLITNGIGITRKDAIYFKENNVRISISIDGLESINDKARVNKNNKGSYLNTLKGYSRLKDFGFDEVGASITLGNHNINNLRENIELLLVKFDFKTIGFNFLIDFPHCKNPFAVDINQATIEVLKTFEFLRNRGIYEDRIMRKLKPFIEEKMHVKDCGSIGNQIVVTPEGMLGPCPGFLYNKKYFSNEIDEVEKIYTSEDFIEWSKRYPLNMEKCEDCVAIGICGGGCPYQAYANKGSIWELDERMCQHNKLFLEWAIWDVFNQKTSARADILSGR